MKNRISVIAFDADDTLWVNEPFFRESEQKFSRLLAAYESESQVMTILFETEIRNLALYGYGIKGFMLSMIETILTVTEHKATPELFERALAIGKEMFDKPVELLPGVEEVLKKLYGKYRLVVATKGDLLDQERKLKKSGLHHYFHHIEIMSDKQESDYEKLVKHLDCPVNEFLMIGNSLKSDVLPVLAIGGNAIHIPFHTTWLHEHVEDEIVHNNFYQMTALADILPKLIGE
ncbi:HAD family hydrolase [Pedobacter namyangjuensis]|uniref:HAD family hydrolase n=1 Tax=Pedobacter namyangjuensis TaxID=600626 RepID=UPI000DE3BD20|nr:HAD family hydrolase [Pedobacter namyangjuensis]